MKRCILGLLCVLALIHRNQAADYNFSACDGARCELLLKTGDTLKVTLPANPTTGYTWTDDCSSKGIIKSGGEKQYHPFKRAKGVKHVVGSGGEEIFQYLVTGRGTTTLSFSYVRPWERGLSPKGLVIWKITVL